MKTTKFISVLTLAVLALTACNDDNEMPDRCSGDAVQFDGRIERMPESRAVIDETGQGRFETTDTWGLYAYNGNAQKLDNRVYKLDGTTPVLWDDLGKGPITFSAHYPRQTTVADLTAFRFTPQGKVFEDDDLLFAAATQSKNGTVNLTFRHLMHRLVINLKAGAGVTSTELSNVFIQTADLGVPTMRATIPVNLLTGELGKPINNANYYSTGPDYDMIVVPQTLTAGADWLKISVGTDVWYYPVPADLNPNVAGNQTTLKSGKRLTLELTLKKTAAGGNEVELTSSGISGWNEQPIIKDDVTIPGTTATITAAEVKAALEGTGTFPIVIDGDLTLDLDERIALGADHTITIKPGAKLTLDQNPDQSSGLGIVCYNRALTINGGGTLFVDEANESNNVIINGSLYLDDVTVDMKGGRIDNCAIEVGVGATIVVDSKFHGSIQPESKTLTVKGDIEVKNSESTAIHCKGTLLIDGGTISIALAGGSTVLMSGNNAKLEIANGGRLGSTVAGGTVYLGENTRVKGASGLFRAADYSLTTDSEVVVGASEATGTLRQGWYQWNTASSVFVWY